MSTEDAFLGTHANIDRNKAEYHILSSLKDECDCEIFLLQLSDIKFIKEYYGEILDYIKSEYKSDKLTLFSIDRQKKYSNIKIGKLSSELEKEAVLCNKAQEISSNGTYVLVKAKNLFSLFHNGKFDEIFDHFIISKNALLEIEAEKYELKDLKLVFAYYHDNRKFKGANYIISDTESNPKVSDSVTEQILRNDLFKFIRKNTKLRLIPEACTSLMRDEESVDISLFDSDNNAAIIEVKFVIGKGFFLSNPKKEKYKFDRFKAGYSQLNRYCNHIYESKLYSIRSAYLYMFYAHSDNQEDIEKMATSYYDEFIEEKEEKETEKFRQQFSGNILDNIVDIDI